MFTRFDKVSSKHMLCRYQYLTSSLGFQPLRSLLTLSFSLLNTTFHFATETHFNAFSFSIFKKFVRKHSFCVYFFIIINFVKKNEDFFSICLLNPKVTVVVVSSDPYRRFYKKFPSLLLKQTINN